MMEKHECKHCEFAKQQPKHGVVDFSCPRCCARLVMQTSYPNKQLAAVVLQQIAMQPKAAPRGQITAVLAELVQANGKV